MSTPVEIRFEKTCASHNPNDNESPNANRSHSQPVNINTPCGQCYCRPFWCLEWYFFFLILFYFSFHFNFF